MIEKVDGKSFSKYLYDIPQDSSTDDYDLGDKNWVSNTNRVLQGISVFENKVNIETNGKSLCFC